MQSLTVTGVPVNAIVNIPAFTLGTTAPIVVTYFVPNPGLAVDFTLRAAGGFNVSTPTAANIRVRCAGLIPPQEVNPPSGFSINAPDMSFWLPNNVTAGVNSLIGVFRTEDMKQEDAQGQ